MPSTSGQLGQAQGVNSSTGPGPATQGSRRYSFNAGGNQRKNLTQSLDASLKRLGLEYIDDVALGPEHLAQLDEASSLRLGFPHSFLASEDVRELIFGSTFALIDSRSSAPA